METPSELTGLLLLLLLLPLLLGLFAIVPAGKASSWSGELGAVFVWKILDPVLNGLANNNWSELVVDVGVAALLGDVSIRSGNMAEEAELTPALPTRT